MTSGTGPNYGWIYDRYGNRWRQNIAEGTGLGPTLSVSFSAATNQISTSGYTYDAAGNMTDDGFHSYTYDGENNLIQVDSSTDSYVYNALNQRVRTVVGSTTTEFVFNAAAQRVSTWNGTTHAQLLGKYYWGNVPAAFYTTTANSAGAAAHFEHQDWLGTERIRTTYNGGVEGTFTSLPFGDGQTTTSGTDLDANHYALLDYDSETETDHAQVRQFSSAQGHWMSPDPYSGSYDFSNPQSFNRYAYVQNGPLGYLDPFGLEHVQLADGCLFDVSSSVSDVTENPDGTYTFSVDDTTASIGCLSDFAFYIGGVLSGSNGVYFSGGGSAPNNGQSYSFVKQWWKDVKNCVGNVALPTIANDLNPLSIGIGTGADIASQMSQASLAGAASWSVSRGLTVPLRSSIVRAGVASAETLGEVSGVLTMASVVYALGDAVVAEYNQCQ